MRIRLGGLRSTLVLTLTGVMLAGVLLISVVVLRITGRLLLDERGRGARVLVEAAVGDLRVDWDASRSATNPVNRRLLEAMVNHLADQPAIAEVLVVDPALTVLASSRPESVGRTIPDSLLAAAVTGGERSVRTVTGPDGIQRLHIHAPIQVRGWTIAAIRAAYKLEGLGQHLDRAQSLILLYILVDVVLLLLIGSYLLDRWIIRPLRQLTKATGRVASGHLTHYVDVRRDDEIGQLSRTFNRMVEHLGDSRAEVESRIEELVEVNRDLRAARHTVLRNEKLASVGTLAAGIAHEVGNPLTAILGYVDILLLNAGDDADRDMLQRIHDQVMRIHGIINELLEYSRPASEEQPNGSLAAATELTASLLRPQPRLRGVEIVTDVPNDLPRVALSEGRLQQIILNLSLNAADAMTDGGALRIEGRVDGDSVRFSVSDDGEGIEPENLNRIFDPFFTSKEPGAGTGLGLAMVDRIIEDHGGTIRAESEVGVGTTFHLRLPIAPTQKKA
jgi:two-component system NtrC family sensor kinase